LAVGRKKKREGRPRSGLSGKKRERCSPCRTARKEFVWAGVFGKKIEKKKGGRKER